MFSIALFALAIAVLLLLRSLRRASADPPPPRPSQPRHVSFSDAPLHKRRASAPPQFLRPPPPPQKSPRRLRLSLSTKRKTSITSTLLQIDHLQPPPTPPAPQRSRLVNPFTKYSRSRASSSPPKSIDTPSSSPSGIPSPLPPARRTLVGKLKSIFKSTSPEPSPITQPKLFKSINAKFRRKPAARTQPYGPPWNAPMPVPDFSLPEHFYNHAHTTSPTPTTGWKRTTSLYEETTMSSAQLSPRKFISEIDEKLLLLQQQRFQQIIPPLHA